jgi:hypothetical protein
MKINHDVDTIRKPAIFTPASVLHFMVGIWFYSILKYYKYTTGQTYLISIILHTIYEMQDLACNNKELCKYFFGISDVHSDYWKNNSIYNSLGDTFTFVLGIAYGQVFLPKMSTEIVKNTTLLVVLMFFTITNFSLG